MSHHDYDDEYSGDTPPPWEIGGPQPALASLLATITVDSPVLDVGCGTGDLAIFLAAQGHRVLGIDASAPGIAKAQTKADDLDLAVEFHVLDATRVGDLDLRPRTVVDSGLLHSLDEAGQVAYVSGLQSICDAGARVCILAVSPDDGMGWGVSSDRFGELFTAADWTGTEIAAVEVHARHEGEGLRLPGHVMSTTRR